MIFYPYSMIESCKSKEEIMELSKGGQNAFSKLENSPKPVVAAIMGPCLGGGLEVKYFYPTL